MNHIQVIIGTNDINLQDLIIAMLSDIGYDGFEQDDNEVKAYIVEEQFDEQAVALLLKQHQLSFNKNIIQQQNWNELWESNFQPVLVDDFVGIRASFHQPLQDVEYEIVITPKMSFGTGHHATTFMMMQLMREVDFTNKTAFDFGSGTGILAILAEKLGAASVLAVDNDDWCIENSQENIEQNNCSTILIKKVNDATTITPFDVVIANINKNIIQDNFELLHQACKPSAAILLSGLLIEDEADILQLSTAKNWHHIKTLNKGAWIAMLFHYETF
jgi:ribosomal protein L11 methyltransferase